MIGGEIYLYDCEKYSPLLNDGTKMFQRGVLGPKRAAYASWCPFDPVSPLALLSFRSPLLKLPHY